MPRKAEEKRTFLIRVQGYATDATILGVRALLKRLGRNFGLKCVQIREEPAQSSVDESRDSRSQTK